MRKKTLFVSILLVFCMASLNFPLLAREYQSQEKEEIELAPKYKAFLVETQLIMHSREKEVFLKLKNDQDRDLFIKSFWQQRGGRQRAVRSNINTLRLIRMIQLLDLTEDQVAAIIPVMSNNEKEKRALQGDLQLQMRDLRLLLRTETSNDQKLEEHLRNIKTQKESLQAKEVEFEKFLEDNLSLVQQAQYIIFSQEFYRGLQEQLENARRAQQELQHPKRKKR